MSAKRLVKKLSSDCHGNIESNKSVVFWSEFQNKIRGQIQIRRNSACNASGIVKVLLRFTHRNSILMTCHYPDLGTVPDWMKQIFNQSEALPRSHWHLNSGLVSKKSFRREISDDGVSKCQLFSQANKNNTVKNNISGHKG